MANLLNKDKPLSMSDEEILAWEIKQENAGMINRKLIPVKFESSLKGKDETIFFISRPTRFTLNTVAELGKKNDFDGANNHLINNCVIAGDITELEKDDELFFGVLEEIGKLANGKKKIS